MADHDLAAATAAGIRVKDFQYPYFYAEESHLQLDWSLLRFPSEILPVGQEAHTSPLRLTI